VLHLLSYINTSHMPAEFAFLGNRIASGLMTPMHGHHDGVAEMLIDSGATSHMVDNAHKRARVSRESRARRSAAIGMNMSSRHVFKTSSSRSLPPVGDSLVAPAGVGRLTTASHPQTALLKRLSGPRDECCFFPKVVLFFPIRIHVHSYACECIHMHFIVFCMHSDALHSTNRLHSNAFCNHFELLHSSDARRLHSDAFSYLLHDIDMLHFHAFSCIQKVRFMLMHSPRDAYVA
jgi:hypothetical protein